MKKLFLSVLIVILNGCSVASGFVASHQSTARQTTIQSDRGRCSSLAMAALTPIGPFCPFRSNAVIELEEEEQQREQQQQQQLADANSGSATATKPGFAETFARIQSQMQLGLSPNPDTLRRVAGEMETAMDRWDHLFVERPRSTPDFCTKEYAAMAETHLNQHGTSTRVIALLVRWQSGCLRALADNRPAPVPPPGLDLNSMMEEAKQRALASSSLSSSLSSSPKDDKTPSITAMQAAERTTAVPFDPETLEFSDDTARDEYHRLVEDHKRLIEAGSGYGGLDAFEKLAFLDRIEAVEDRWDSFFVRFCEESPMVDALNQDYVDQCTNYLSCMKLTNDEYRQLLRDTHQRMRRDAERER